MMKAIFDEIAKDVSWMNTLGRDFDNSLGFEGFIQVVINLWAPIKSNKLKLFSNAKKNKINQSEGGRYYYWANYRQVLVCVSLGCCQISARWWSMWDFGKNKFSMVPQSMFECDGTMHMYQAKSILHGLPKQAPTANVTGTLYHKGLSELQS